MYQLILTTQTIYTFVFVKKEEGEVCLITFCTSILEVLPKEMKMKGVEARIEEKRKFKTALERRNRLRPSAREFRRIAPKVPWERKRTFFVI